MVSMLFYVLYDGLNLKREFMKRKNPKLERLSH